MPKAAQIPLLYAFCFFPLLPRISRRDRGSKNGPEGPPLSRSKSWKILERAKGFEPSTPTLARCPMGLRQSIQRLANIR